MVEEEVEDLSTASRLVSRIAMKLRGLIVATVILLALVGALYWSGKRKATDDATASKDAPPAILKLDEASITKLEIKKKDAAPLVLSRTSSGDWQILQPKAFGADQSTVSGVLGSLASLNSERLVEEKTSDLKPYGLDQPRIEVDLTEKNNKSHRLLIGEDTPTGGAVYAALAGDPRVFTIASYTKTSIDKSLNDLRDKRLLTVNPDKISRVELARKNQTIEFGRDKDEWQILKPKPLRADSYQVGELVQKLTGARMDLGGDETDAKKAEALFASGTPVAAAKVTDSSGTQEIQIHKSKDVYYGKSNVVEGVYKVQSDLGQAVDKSLGDFRNKKIFDFGFSDPSKIEMHNGTKALFLVRSGTDWWWNGKKVDAGTVQSLIAKLRDLSASKFVESGFGNPSIQISVTSDDGKHIDKVSLAKSGDSDIAKRDNDASLYGLDSNAVDDLQKAADEIKPATAVPSK